MPLFTLCFQYSKWERGQRKLPPVPEAPLPMQVHPAPQTVMVLVFLVTFSMGR